MGYTEWVVYQRYKMYLRQLPKSTIAIGLTGLSLIWLALGVLLWTTKTAAPQLEKSTAATQKTVVIAGDIACAPGRVKTEVSCRHDETASLITRLNPDAVLLAGDNQYPDGALEAYLASYDKTWGAFKDITYPVPGNHEYQTPNAAGYFDYFEKRAGERGKGYYSFKLGDWRFLALNSEIDVSADSAQLTWLKQELETNKQYCTLAYWHKPRFSAGGHDDDTAFDPLWRLLYQHGTDVIVNGHSHNYERFVQQNPDGRSDPKRGIVEFVSGMGGSHSQPLYTAPSTLAARQNHSFGVLRLTLFAKTVRYEFVPVDTQAYSDTGILQCH